VSRFADTCRKAMDEADDLDLARLPDTPWFTEANRMLFHGCIIDNLDKMSQGTDETLPACGHGIIHVHNEKTKVAVMLSLVANLFHEGVGIEPSPTEAHAEMMQARLIMFLISRAAGGPPGDMWTALTQAPEPEVLEGITRTLNALCEKE
jgi:hypothetical protein